MNKKSKQIELTVAWHPSENYTLMQRNDGDVMHTDLKGALFCNSDAAKFYRAVAQLIADHAHRGYQIVYSDI